tara:strand:+ start:15795 stop:16823 length:1029 start_codon:yes stop_codon:yes gene_type:complete
MNLKECLSFDDVLLVPRYSDICSRKDVDISSDLGQGIKLKLPVISSPMDTVTGSEMAMAMASNGGLGIVHRYNTPEEQAELIRRAVHEGTTNLGAAIGMTGDFYERAVEVVESGANVLCIDVAHGHHEMMEVCIKKIKDRFGSSVHVMAGNVATLEAFDCLASWGADSVRVGIGGGSICSTRLVTGHGVPTFQSILDCQNTTYETKIIADGGIKTTGDMVKALAAGADFVMVGSMLSGTDETPGNLLTNARGEKHKEYRGMASKEAQRSWRGKNSTPEGVATVVPYKGPVVDILEDFRGGIRSGLSYSGVRSIGELRCVSSFIRQTNAGQVESNTHIKWRAS